VGPVNPKDDKAPPVICK